MMTLWSRNLLFDNILLVLLAMMLLTPAVKNVRAEVGDQIQVKEQDLENLRKELARKRAETEQLAGKEKSVLSEIKNLEERVDLAEKLLRKLKSKKESCQQEISSLRADLENAERRSAARRKVLAERARHLYMHGRLGELEAFLSAETLPDLASRVYRYRHVADSDRRLIQDALEDQRAISVDKAALERQLEETRQLEKEKKRQEDQLKGEKEVRSKLLREIRDQKAAHEQAIREMEESARQIQDIIDLLERQQQRVEPSQAIPPDFQRLAGQFEQLQGSLPWPVQGKVIRAFGKQTHPKYKTVTFNKGIDIAAPSGAEIRAVAAGKVLYSSWLRGYGKFLILSHTKGYYTLYAHASELLVEEGDLIQAGEVIARVGETGSLEGAKLHFEVRHSKEQLDPLKWLKP